MATAEPYILFVDDDEDDRVMIRECCEQMNVAVNVRFLISGEALFPFLSRISDQEEYPSLIVLDVNMPGLRGEEVLVLLKRDPQFRHLPVVMFSTSDYLQERYLTLGAEAFYQKPNTCHELHQQIDTILKRLSPPLRL